MQTNVQLLRLHILNFLHPTYKISDGIYRWSTVSCLITKYSGTTPQHECSSIYNGVSLWNFILMHSPTFWTSHLLYSKEYHALFDPAFRMLKALGALCSVLASRGVEKVGDWIQLITVLLYRRGLFTCKLFLSRHTHPCYLSRPQKTHRRSQIRFR